MPVPVHVHVRGFFNDVVPQYMYPRTFFTQLRRQHKNPRVYILLVLSHCKIPRTKRKTFSCCKVFVRNCCGDLVASAPLLPGVCSVVGTSSSVTMEPGHGSGGKKSKKAGKGRKMPTLKLDEGIAAADKAAAAAESEGSATGAARGQNGEDAVRSEADVLRDIAAASSAMLQQKSNLTILTKRLETLRKERHTFMSPRTVKRDESKHRAERAVPVPTTKSNCCWRCLTRCCLLACVVWGLLFAMFGSIMTFDDNYEVTQGVLDRVSSGLVVGLNETFAVKTLPRPGELLAAEGRRKRFPVVIVPGV